MAAAVADAPSWCPTKEMATSAPAAASALAIALPTSPEPPVTNATLSTRSMRPTITGGRLSRHGGSDGWHEAPKRAPVPAQWLPSSIRGRGHADRFAGDNELDPAIALPPGSGIVGHDGHRLTEAERRDRGRANAIPHE